MWYILFLFTNNLALMLLLAWKKARYKERIRQLELMVSHDPLTHLYNRRGFDDAFGRALSVSRRTGRPFSLLILDIDKFKAINDTYGHAKGDVILKVVASTLEEQCRRSDTVARIGGEEFGIILPDTEFDHALLLADRIRMMVERLGEDPGVNLHITISIGVTSGVDESYDAMYARADRNLYHAKQTGRNKVVGQ